MKFLLIVILLTSFLFKLVSCNLNHFNNAILANHNFLNVYNTLEEKEINDVDNNDLKNHIITTFENCKWDALLIVDAPGLNWDKYELFDNSFKNLQQYLRRSGTIDQIPVVSKQGQLDNDKLIIDWTWTFEHKCNIKENNVVLLNGNNTSNEFKPYIDTSKRIIILKYDEDFLADEEFLDERLKIIDMEIGLIIGSAPSSRTNLVIIGSSEKDKEMDIVFPDIFKKNDKTAEEHRKALLEKKEKGRNTRQKFEKYSPRFSDSLDNSDNGMLLADLKTDIIAFATDQEDILKIIGASIVGLIVIIYFFL
ncbi:hypothetical protein QEN19_002212 [Hanseniaspora menglaensis]